MPSVRWRQILFPVSKLVHLVDDFSSFRCTHAFNSRSKSFRSVGHEAADARVGSGQAGTTKFFDQGVRFLRADESRRRKNEKAPIVDGVNADANQVVGDARELANKSCGSTMQRSGTSTPISFSTDIA